MAVEKKKKEQPKVGEKSLRSAQADGVSDGKMDSGNFGKLTNRAELNTFLNSVRDRLADDAAAPVHALAAMHYLLRQPGVYEWLDNENKEIARDIWLRLKKAGMQLRCPPMLFSEEEQASL